MNSSKSGYKYGLWFIPYDYDYTYIHSTLHMKHIPHITLICNIPTKTQLYLLYNSICNYLSNTSSFLLYTHPISLSHISYDINNDDNCDVLDHSWGYTCKWDDDNVDIYSLIHTFINKLNIQGSVSSDFHMTIQYDQNMSLFENEINTMKRDFGNGNVNCNTDKNNILIRCKLVMADIRDHNPAMWRIIE